MPKSYGNLWPQVTSWDRLVAAYQRCRRRKRFKPEALQFDFEWEANLLKLQRELLDGSYRPGPYRHFHIQDPKPRRISAAPFRDRIVHHAVVGALEPIYERRFIHDSYACRVGKGTHRALQRAQSYLRKYRYVLKTDVVKFFPNVDHEILLTTLARTIHDPSLMTLIRLIIASGEGVLADERTLTSFPGDDLFTALRPCGLPIGNLTSQFFANVLLDGLDHFIKEELRVPGDVRYADDLLLFADDQQSLWQTRESLAGRLARLRLRLHSEKTQVAPCSVGVGFLGFRVTPTDRRLLCSALRRFNRRLRRMKWWFSHGLLDGRRITATVRAWLAHSNTATSDAPSRALLRQARFQRRESGRSFDSLAVGRDTSLMTYAQELSIGIAAVRRAALVCRNVQRAIPAAMEKQDKSPVTIADFASQAMICRALGEAFPNDPIIGEEDSAELRLPENKSSLDRVLAELSRIAVNGSADDVCGWIDRGGTHSFGPRFWTLDPIDGTKGFLRGEQYAISLALIVEGQVTVAIVGCPNLPLEPGNTDENGSIFFAVRGQGTSVLPCFQPLPEGEGMTVRVTSTSNWSDVRLCESVESGHSAQDRSAAIAASLGIVKPPVRIDSQAKYAVVARGEADVYLRLPTKKDYREKIWDHAGGMLVVEEAGGRVTDIDGKPLEFIHGRELAANRGIVVTNDRLHEDVLRAIHTHAGSR